MQSCLLHVHYKETKDFVRLDWYDLNWKWKFHFRRHGQVVRQRIAILYPQFESGCRLNYYSFNFSKEAFQHNAPCVASSKFQEGSEINKLILVLDLNLIIYPFLQLASKRTTNEKLVGNQNDKFLHLIFTTWLNIFCTCYEGFFSLQLNRKIHIKTLFMN